MLLGAHRLGDAGIVIPATGLLHKRASGLEGLDLARHLVVDRPAHPAEGVHVFDLHLGAQLGGAFGPDADVDVAAHHALFHVAVADAAVDQDVLERVEVFVRHVRAADVRLGNDLQQRHSGPVEINAAVLIKVVVFADVLLEMGTRDAHALDASLELEVYMPGCGGRKIKLGDLVVLADVRVKIVFAIELRKLGHLAV